MSTVALRAAGLTKRYGSVRALDGLDLEVGVGEVHAFLGPNGAGKTTTIRILLGLLRKDGGEVSLLGDLGPSRRSARSATGSSPTRALTHPSEPRNTSRAWPLAFPHDCEPRPGA
jgi:ABC-type multidrug transport system ATPase subunit